MSDELLQEKIKELQLLQQEYDDFVESSKEIEAELEMSVKNEIAKLNELQKKYNVLEEKLGQSNNKAASLSSEYIKISSEMSKAKEKIQTLEEEKRSLEIQNHELQEKVRALESNESNLQHKVTTLEEEVYFTQNDLFELEKVKADSELRLKAELTQLQAELAHQDQSVATNGDSESVQRLHDRINELEVQNNELNEEISRMTEELMSFNSQKPSNSSSEEEINKLRQQFDVNRNQIVSLTNQVNDLNQSNEQLQNQIIELQQSLSENERNSIELGEELERTQEELLTKARQIDELKSVILTKDNETRSLIEDLHRQIETKIIEYDCIQTQLIESNMKISTLEMNLRSLSTENDSLTQQLDDAMKSLSDSRKEFVGDDNDKERCEQLTSENRQLNEELDKLRSQLSLLNTKLNKLELKSPHNETAIPNQINPLSPRRDNSFSSTSSILSSPDKKDLTIQLENIYNQSTPGTLRRSISSFAKKSTPKVGSLRRISSLMIPDNALLSPTARNAEIAAIDEAIDKIDFEQILLESSTTTRLTARKALMTKDVTVLSEELLKQTRQLEELKKTNAKLLQQVVQGKNAIQVCCRARPPIDQEVKDGKICVDVVDDSEIACYDKRGEAWRSFYFDKVWPIECTQADIFADVEPLIISSTEGYNVCIMAYGQTGSGKTYTMNGYGKEFGVSYRTIHKMFELLELKKHRAKELIKKGAPLTPTNVIGGDSVTGFKYEAISGMTIPERSESLVNATGDDDNSIESPFKYTVEVSMLEIYNEQINDLLNPVNMNGSLEIRQNPEGGTHVPGLKLIPVLSLHDVMNVFAQGSSNRATASTNLNERSSRSHLILTIHITTTMEGSATVKGRLNLVDLAGSEKVSKSGVTGTAMKEAQHINKSLSALGDVFEALDQKLKHIPYRNSKLTYLLQDSFSGMSKTMMIVTVCPTEYTVDETLFTLQFASRVRNVSFANTASRRHLSTKNLEEGMKLLKVELKEMKRQKTIAEENQNELKKEIKRIQEKYSTLADSKTRAVEDIRKSNETNIQWLTKQNQDLTTRLLEEKEQRQRMMSEVDTLNKTVKRLQEQMKSHERYNGSNTEKERERSGSSGSHSMNRPGSSNTLNTMISTNTLTNNSRFGRPVATKVSRNQLNQEAILSNFSSSNSFDIERNISLKEPASPQPSIETSSIIVTDKSINESASSLTLQLPAKTISSNQPSPTITEEETIALRKSISSSLASRRTAAEIAASISSKLPSPISFSSIDGRPPYSTPRSIGNTLLNESLSPPPASFAAISQNDDDQNTQSIASGVMDSQSNEQLNINRSDNFSSIGFSPSGTKVMASTTLVSLPTSPEKIPESRSRSNSATRGSDNGSVRSNSSVSVSRITRGNSRSRISDVQVQGSVMESTSRPQSRASNASGSTTRSSRNRSTSSLNVSTTSGTTIVNDMTKTSIRPMPASIASRSKDALQKHQERMDKIREQRAVEAKALSDRINFGKVNAPSNP